jgi:hypothetical protein
VGGKGGDRGKRGEMTQTLYPHVKKRKKVPVWLNNKI